MRLFLIKTVELTVFLYYNLIMNINQVIRKEPIDMAEDIVYRWFSFIRFDNQISSKKMAVLFILIKILCLKFGLPFKSANEMTKAIVDNWISECSTMDINDPDAQHHLVLMVESLIIELKTFKKTSPKG